MALSLSSPCGYPIDEDEEMPVFESTAAEQGGLSRPRLPEISVISPGLNRNPSIAELVRHYQHLASYVKCQVDFSFQTFSL